MNKDVLIVVDVQYDFVPVSDEYFEKGLGGALAVSGGNEIVPVINELLSKFELVIFTKDWHPIEMEAFASSHPDKKPFDSYINSQGVEDILWPDHCIRETIGAELHHGIQFENIKGDFYIFKKGMTKDFHPYGGFNGTGLGDFLRERKIENTYIVGLALDYCVKDTALESVEEDFNTVVIEDGTAAISEDLNELYKIFKENNIPLIESFEIDEYRMNIIKKAKIYAHNKHTSDDYHTRYHLQITTDYAIKFIHLIPEEDRDDVIAGCWCHDLIEDVKLTYNDVKNNTSKIVAEYAYALTNEKGRNRKERGNAKYYNEMKAYRHASFIKLCDRLANTNYSKFHSDKIFEMYKNEYIDFKMKLFDGRWKEMWVELENLNNN